MSRTAAGAAAERGEIHLHRATKIMDNMFLDAQPLIPTGSARVTGLLRRRVLRRPWLPPSGVPVRWPHSCSPPGRSTPSPRLRSREWGTPPLSVLTWLNVPPGTTPGTPVTTFGDGHVYVLEFTADWCTQCPGYYPIMDSLPQKFGLQGLRLRYVTAIFWQQHDSTTKNPNQQQVALLHLLEYIDQHHLHHPVGVFGTGRDFGKSGYYQKRGKGYAVGVPKSVLIDGKGIVRAVNVLDDDDDGYTKIAALLGAAQDSASPAAYSAPVDTGAATASSLVVLTSTVVDKDQEAADTTPLLKKNQAIVQAHRAELAIDWSEEQSIVKISQDGRTKDWINVIDQWKYWSQ